MDEIFSIPPIKRNFNCESKNRLFQVLKLGSIEISLTFFYGSEAWRTVLKNGMVLIGWGTITGVTLLQLTSSLKAVNLLSEKKD